MLAYEHSQNTPFRYSRHDFGYQDIDNDCGCAHLDRLPSVIGAVRTPLLPLQNSCSPCPQKSSYFTTNCQPMQQFARPSQPFNRDEASHMPTEQNVTTQDSGLGILGNENIFGGTYQNSDVEESSYLLHDEQNAPTVSEHANRLASPFSGEEHMPTIDWSGTYPGSTLSDGYRANYVSTPQHAFIGSEHVNPGLQYTMSPANLTPVSGQYGSWPQGRFERPMNRHNSDSSGVPQSTNFSFATPNTEAPPFQWTPQSATPEWYGATDYRSNASNMPTVMLDYSACNNGDHSLDFVQPQQRMGTRMTVPQRRKPRLRPSLSESCVPRISTPARMRAASMGQFLQAPPYHQNPNNGPVQQLLLPPLPPSVLINTLQFHQPSNTFPGTPAPSHHHSRSCSNTPIRRKRPSSPPPSDFNKANTPYLVPVRQEPTFSGDLYTPQYKRRTPNGRWEGWCGYCQPGRWLDLKNSRFWEDKLRNHGICAKTKMRFAEPEEIRWVTTGGSVISETEPAAENSDLFLEQRKREGLCGTCNTWVGMDGLRTKARDRAVGWWMHAYKVRLLHRTMKLRTNVLYSATTMTRP